MQPILDELFKYAGLMCSSKVKKFINIHLVVPAHLVGLIKKIF